MDRVFLNRKCSLRKYMLQTANMDLLHIVTLVLIQIAAEFGRALGYSSSAEMTETRSNPGTLNLPFKFH